MKDDPTTDYSTAISNAINMSTGATLYFPHGTYYIAHPILINHTASTGVKRLVFFGAKFSPSDSGFTGSEVIDVQHIPTQGFWIENMLLVTNYAKSQSFSPVTSPSILQEATATPQLVIRNSENISFTGVLGAGTAYFESVNFDHSFLVDKRFTRVTSILSSTQPLSRMFLRLAEVFGHNCRELPLSR